MTLCDTGPLIALVNKNDKYRDVCVRALMYLPRPLVTTWPCFVEAMYMVAGGGFGPKKLLWEYVLDGPVRFHVPQDGETLRMAELMEIYQSVPMDLADASLVAAAEILRVRRIFSTDGDFYVYRLPREDTFEVIPGPA